MSETNEEITNPVDEKKPLRLNRPGKLELKKTVEGGQVRQKFSHGRSKVVAVEVRKKRTYALDDAGQMTKVRARPAGEVVPEISEPEVDGESEAARAANVQLTNHEKAARARALQDFQRAEEDQPVSMAPTGENIESESAIGGEAAAEPTLDSVAEEQAALVAETPSPTLEGPTAEATGEPKEGAEITLQEEPAPAVAPVAPVAGAKIQPRDGEPEDGEERPRGRRPGTPLRRPSLTARRGEPRRRPGKITIVEALDDGDERTRSLASVRRARERERKRQSELGMGDLQKVVRDVIIPDEITVQELASRMAERSNEVIRALMRMDVMATVNQLIDADTAEIIATEFGHNVRRVSEADVEIGLGGASDGDTSLKARPPVVTVMGHVDHGKTSLLDALRQTDVVAGEAGGITQHIGAYQVTLPSGNKITFVDTPGHAAFTEMRSRGAKVTDIVVLVVAADDGIMPQTKEAIDHAKAAGVPIIVAINKMDLPNADANRVRQELLQHNLVAEEMGGDILTVEVSATKKLNLDKLQEAILLQAELLELTANPDRAAKGVVIESRIEHGRGSVATVLISRGTLRGGDIFVAGGEWGRVRALVNDHGSPISEAGPGMPVEVLGLSGTPDAGDDFVVVDTESRARQVTEFRQRKQRDARAVGAARGTLEEMLSRIQEGEAKEMAVLVKADVHGSVEAINTALNGLSTDEVKVSVLHAAVGGINESDVTLARASNAIVIGFNVRANPQARDSVTTRSSTTSSMTSVRSCPACYRRR
jgi:translation initiation factor IF-2